MDGERGGGGGGVGEERRRGDDDGSRGAGDVADDDGAVAVALAQQRVAGVGRLVGEREDVVGRVDVAGGGAAGGRRVFGAG